MTRSAPYGLQLRRIGALTVVMLVTFGTGPWTPFRAAFPAAAAQVLPPASGSRGAGETIPDETPLHEPNALHDVQVALVRLPLAAVLGAALSLRPKRRGTPQRDAAVVQTQIILAVVGAVIMLVVGASLARAFGIVGAANLIRYRSKIDDPKDAVVMLCTLAVGLASGVGLYALAVVSTGFIGGALWVTESFEPAALKRFDLTVKAGKDTDALREKIEAILRRFKLDFELRTSSDEEVCYDVQVPLGVQTDLISDAILSLDPDGHAAVEWSEKKNKPK
jgi:uncharacterized membrane protein YhiD involved in acid resistance